MKCKFSFFIPDAERSEFWIGSICRCIYILISVSVCLYMYIFIYVCLSVALYRNIIYQIDEGSQSDFLIIYFKGTWTEFWQCLPFSSSSHLFFIIPYFILRPLIFHTMWKKIHLFHFCTILRQSNPNCCKINTSFF